MLGRDSEDDAEGPSEPVADDGMDELARRAAGDSVTADRLRGEEQYFPDCRWALQEGQQPHHLLLLTTLHPTLRMTAYAGGSSGHRAPTDLDASTGGVAVVTGEALLVVVDASVCEVPYGRIQGTVDRGDVVEVHGTGQIRYELHVANAADHGEVAAAYGYLRRMVREHA